MKKAINQSMMTYIINGVSILALLFTAFSLFCYSNVNNKVDVANAQRFDLTYNANRFMNGSAYLTNEVRAYATTGLQEHYDNYWNEVNNLKNRDAGVAKMKEIGITDEEQQMIDEMSELSNTLVPLEEQAMKDVQAKKKDKAVQYVYGQEYDESIDKINSLKSQFLETIDNRTSNEVDRLIKVSHFIRFCLIFSLVVVIVLQSLNMRLVKVKILRPILAIRDQMGEIAQGNLSADFSLEPDTSEIGQLVGSIQVTKKELKKYIGDIDDKLAEMAKGNMDLEIGHDYRGEFLPIQDALRQILDALNTALKDIEVVSNQVADGSEQVASGAQELSQGAAEQSASIEDLTVRIKEISEQIVFSLENANTSRDCSIEASKQLMFSTEKMQELVVAMDDISNASSQINGINKTIEDIAFQTNILALNAAVEAARAGMAGKGFAVVADEVRNLAAKSSEAAQDTTALIENMVKMVENGVSLTTETTEALNGVVSGAKRSTELVQEIADSSEGQSASLKRLTKGIEQISNVVQNNAATAEESAASSQELSGQAAILKASIEHFKLRG